MRNWVDYLIHFRHEDPDSSLGVLTDSTTTLHEEEVTCESDIAYMESRLETEQGFKQVTILAFSKIG